MRKIVSLGLSVLTGSVLAFGSPIAAHAVSTTPNQDALCADDGVPQTISDLEAAVASATTDKAAADAAQATKSDVVIAAAEDLASTASTYVNALDGVGDTTTTQAAFNASSTAFSTAVSDWQASYLAATTAQNTLYGSNFLLAFNDNVIIDLCTPAAG